MDRLGTGDDSRDKTNSQYNQTPNNGLSQNPPRHGIDTFGTSFKISSAFGGWSFSGMDSNNYSESSGSRSYSDSNLATMEDPPLFPRGPWLGEHSQGQPMHISRKRGGDGVTMESNPHKRHRGLHSYKKTHLSKSFPEISKEQGSREHKRIWNDGHNDKPVQPVHNFRPERYGGHLASENMAGLSSSAETPDHESCDHTISQQISQRYGTTPGNYERSHLPHPKSRNGGMIGSSSNFNGSQVSENPSWTLDPRVFGHAKPLTLEKEWNLGELNSYNDRKFGTSEPFEPKISMPPPSGNRLRRNSSDIEPPRRSSPAAGQPARIVHGQGSQQLRPIAPQLENASFTNRRAALNRGMQTYPDSELGYKGYDAPQIQGQHSTSDSSRGFSPDPMETSKMILAHISCDANMSRSSISTQTPLYPGIPIRNMAAPGYTNKGPNLRGLQPQSKFSAFANIPKCNNNGVHDHDDELDSIPIERLLKQRRRGLSSSKTDTRQSQCRAAGILPRKSMSYNDRQETNTINPRTRDERQSSTGRYASPIYIDSAPQSPVNAFLTKKSVPMKDRLSLPKSKANSKAKTDPVEDKQRRAAEIIIKKELEALDKDIFGEAIGDSLEETQSKRELARIETQQKRDEKKLADLIKVEMDKAAELERKRLQEEAAEKERVLAEKAEERKKEKREKERKRQLALDEATKEERRRKAQEQIEAQKELSERRKKEQDQHKAILMQSEVAMRIAMELKREAAKQQASSLTAATFSRGPKVSTGPLDPTEDEDSLFLPLPTKSSRVRSSDYESVSDVDQRSRAKNPIPRTTAENFSTMTNARSSFLDGRDAFYAKEREEAEKKTGEELKAKLAARYSKDSVPKGTSGTRTDKQKDGPRKHRGPLKARTPTKANSNNISREILLHPNDSETQEDTSHGRPRLPRIAAISPPPAPPAPKKYSSTINLVSDVKTQKLEGSTKQQRAEQKNEARRIRDGERARNNHRERLLKDAEDGDYTISEHEMNKRLDAYMKKREEKYEKKKARQAGSLNRNSMVVSESESISEPRPPMPTQPQESSEPEVDEDDDPVVDPEEQAREQGAIDMREAIEALAKENPRGSRFAKIAARRTVSALQSDSEDSEESDESEEDPDDNPALESPFTKNPKDLSVPKESNGNESSQDKFKGDVEVARQVDTPAADAPGPDDLPIPATLEQPSVDMAHASTSQPSPIGNKMVRVYTVKMLRKVDGEEQPMQDLQKFLNYSEANSFAEDKAKEYSSHNHTPDAQNYVDQLFHSLVAKDDNNSTEIWVASEIEQSSKIVSFDASILKPRFPTSSWLIHFKTVTEAVDDESKASSTNTTTTILPGHQYSDLELANHAACEYLIQYLKPKRPVLTHLEQYENDIIPILRDCRDNLCTEMEPMWCELEKDETQLQWLVEKQVEIGVVSYEMQGPLN